MTCLDPLTFNIMALYPEPEPETDVCLLDWIRFQLDPLLDTNKPTLFPLPNPSCHCLYPTHLVPVPIRVQ